MAIPASNWGDLSAYLRSLKRVQSLEPARVLPAHGPVIEGGAKAYVERAFARALR